MEKLTKSFLVEPSLAGVRLDKFLAISLGGEYSRQKIQDYIRRGDVRLDDQVQTVPKFPVPSGSMVTIQVPVLMRRLEGQEVDFEVLYQDRDMAIINKPAGLVVHPETESGLPHEGAPTLAHGLVRRFPELEDEDNLRPGIVHRLDKDTSGLLVVGLSEEGREYLKGLFSGRAIHKEYLALVHGVPEEAQGEIDLPIGRHPTRKTSMAVVDGGKEALTRYRVVYADNEGLFSVLAVSIVTGRTHQIRVHLSAMGHPIIGDNLYTLKDRLEDESLATPLAALQKKKARERWGSATGRTLPHAARQMLHAWRLAFAYEGGHEGGEFPQLERKGGLLTATCPPPSDFIEFIEQLVHDPLRVVVTGMPGSGKSSFVGCLEKLGVPVFSADACVRELYGPDGDGAKLLRMRFGDAYANESGVDKQALGEAMRLSDSLRREIEDMIHPLVYHNLAVFWRDNEQHTLAVAEIPLFFESDAAAVDVVIGVSCPFVIRAARLRETRGWSEEVIRAMEAWQLSEEEKMARCDMVVANTSDLRALDKEARTLYGVLQKRYRQRIQERMASIIAAWEGLSLLP